MDRRENQDLLVFLVLTEDLEEKELLVSPECQADQV